MKYLNSRLAGLVVLAAASLPAAADWDAAAVGHDLSHNHMARALAAIQNRLDNHPDDPRARFLKAMAQAQTGHAQQAIALYEKLARQYPQRARVWNNLGVLYARRGRLDDARDALNRAVQAESGYADAQANLGDVYVVLADRAYHRAQQHGANDSVLARRRKGLEGLLPSLPDDSDALSDSARIHQQIDQVLSRWAQARSRQNLSAYLSLYSDDYQPPGDASRAAWIRRQRQRIQQGRAIQVSVSDLKVEDKGADLARATFHEHYGASGDEHRRTKHMTFVREDGAWRIRKDS